MDVEQRPDGWWIIEVPECCDCGPYDTKAEAESDMRGIARAIKYGDIPGFTSVDELRSSAEKQATRSKQL